jgi:hypothetical protein
MEEVDLDASLERKRFESYVKHYGVREESAPSVAANLAP